jgi:SPOR domain
MHFADKEDFALAAPEISRLPFKFSVSTAGALSIIFCAAGVIAVAGTLLFSKNYETSLAWFDQPKQLPKTEVAGQSSGSKAASLMPATVKPLTLDEPPNQQPSAEELRELAKLGRALLTAETASLAPATEVEIQAVAPASPSQQTSEKLAELMKRQGLPMGHSPPIVSVMPPSAPTDPAAVAPIPAPTPQVSSEPKEIRRVTSGTDPPATVDTKPELTPPAAPIAVGNAHSTAVVAPSVSGGGFAVQVTSERNESNAQAALQALLQKYPNQLSGRQPIIRRVDLGAKGIYYRVLVGPFASAEEAAGLCSKLKAAGGNCIVQTN